ncbi:MAG: ATP-binding protein, partial [Pseudonocardiaceae bacterium]
MPRIRLLLERDHELAVLDAALTAARDGLGGVAVIEGPPGIGKSRLLAVARAMARGFTVLAARGGELEQDFPWGVVRQLFEAEVALADLSRRKTLLAGAAATATEPLGRRRDAASGDVVDRDVASPGDASFAALHGLYWLAVNLAADGPVLLCVDDVQWADAASLRFLLYLGARVEELPLLILTAQRPVPPGAAHDLVAQTPAATVVRPRELTEPAVGALITEALEPAEPQFISACYRATGGNPFLVAELLTQLRATGVAPLDAEAGRIEHLGPRAVAQAVLRRLTPLADGASALARAVAMLGTDVQLRHAAALAELTETVARRAADALAAAEVLRPGRPLEFVHPVVRAAVREDLPAGERMALHRRSAEILLADGATPGRVGVHLLATDPAGLPWVVQALGDAAQRALARGAPDAAAEF